MPSHLLTLQNIGKIYVSEGSVAVGIRGVNLSFDRGEFVAVTGKSGSGKSTLLSVISGMDTYEEGDLLIEGNSTAHYTQPDWEAYRQKYISFIFQDYNIIESFTVLQNVELALIHIQNPAERRKRALELLDRVGLSKHLGQKGSQLSGGQKQRTVIARALAKESPIILADEPTGNLDSETGKEIIELLREVSKDKLVIVVTHNFEQIEYCSTRHIRIYDGAVESDKVIKAPAPQDSYIFNAKPPKTLHSGYVLGHAMCFSRPKLTVFMSFLLIVGMLALFFSSSMFSDMLGLFEKDYMFNPVEGRVVLTKANGTPLTDDEVTALAEKYGAKSSLHYDKLLDKTYYFYDSDLSYGVNLRCAFDETVKGKVYGRYPTAKDEVLLRLPVGFKTTLGTTPEEDGLTRTFNAVVYKVVGISYYYDNTEEGVAVFTKDGYETQLVYSTFLGDNSETYARILYKPSDEAIKAGLFNDYDYIDEEKTQGSFDYKVEIYAGSGGPEAGRCWLPLSDTKATPTSVTICTSYYEQNVWNDYFSKAEVEYPIDLSLVDVRESTAKNYGTLILSQDLAVRLTYDYLASSYRQASLFFGSNKEARAVLEDLRADGYIAVMSDSTYSPDPLDTILSTVLSVADLILWVLVAVFIAFFINLCSSRTIGAFKGDLAIMRSMGIPVKVIRLAMYVRMFLTLIPSLVILAGGATAIYLIPKTNKIFAFLHWWQYAIICLGMAIIVHRVTGKQIKRLFGESVKKSLRGGDAE